MKSVFRLTLGPVVQYSDERVPLIGEDTLISADLGECRGDEVPSAGVWGTLSGGQCEAYKTLP